MSDGGRVVPDFMVEKIAAYLTVSNEWWEDTFGFPLMGRGLAYWQQKEREMVAARRPKARLRRTARRFSWFVRDWPRRLRNARGALAGEWEYRPEDE